MLFWPPLSKPRDSLVFLNIFFGLLLGFTRFAPVRRRQRRTVLTPGGLRACIIADLPVNAVDRVPSRGVYPINQQAARHLVKWLLLR